MKYKDRKAVERNKPRKSVCIVKLTKKMRISVLSAMDAVQLREGSSKAGKMVFLSHLCGLIE